MASKLFKFVIFVKFIMLVHTFADVDTIISLLPNGFGIFGAAQSDRLGISSASGDFNGDGIPDIVVGSYFATGNGRSGAGVAYVIMGKTSGFSDIDLASSFTGFKIIGPEASASLGFRFSSIEDMNGDGADEIIVGVYRATSLGRSGAGMACVVFGQKNTYSDVDTANDLAALGKGFKIFGAAFNDHFGSSVSGLGDINGDGKKDMIFGTFGLDPYGRTDAGAAYVIFGQSSFTDVDVNNDLVAFGQGFKIFGAAAGDNLGTCLGDAGDINNDGIKDILISAPAATSSTGRTYGGKVYVIFGRSTNTFVDIDLAGGLNGIGFDILGAAANNRLGTSMSAGDVNGNGISDLILGAIGVEFSSKANVGAGYVIFGQSGITQIDLNNSLVSSSQGFTIYGAVTGDSLGGSVDSLGDVNGDGIGDFILGAASSSPQGRSIAGTAYIMFGRTNGISDIDLSTFNTALGYKIIGPQAYKYLGSFVGGVGDMNQDGINDIIVGAYASDPMGRTNAGAAYVILLPCSSGDTKIFNNACYASCPSGCFSLSGANCGACMTGCLACSSSGATCTSCDSGSGYLKLYNGVCYTTCPSATYSTSGTGCSACGTGCLVCSGSGSTCTSCDSGSGYLKLYNGICYASCPSGTYSTSGTGCSACENGCLTCSGSGPTCTLCDIGYNKLYNGTCYVSCPSGTYSTSGTGCLSCETGCLNCPGSGPTCSLCDSGYTKLYNGTCYNSCPSGTYSTSGTGCSECEAGCLACSSSGSTCTLCNSSAGYIKLYGGVCYQSCPNGSYPIVGSGCEACQNGCLVCSGRENCTSCDSSLGYTKLDNGTCSAPNNKCPNYQDYYFPQEGICDSKCVYPYHITNPFVCELPLLSADEMATIKSTAEAIDVANQLTRISGTIAIPITAYDPWFLMFISSTQLLFYVRYMEVGFSPQLQKVFQAKKDPLISLQIDPDTNSIYSLPLKFKQYSVPPRFLVNFWQPTLILFITISVILIISLLKKLAKNHTRLYSILDKIHLTLKWNYLLMNFTSYYHLLVLYTSIELRTLTLNSFLQVFSLLICLLINSFGLIIPYHLFRVVRAYRNQSRKIIPTNGDLTAEENLSTKWKSYEVILKPFKDSLVQQSFIPIWILKTYLFTMVLAYLFDHPLAQGILLTLLSWSMFLYLIITRPVKNFVTQVQYVVMEMMFCLVSLCVLILGGLDQGNATASETREGLSNTILYSILVFTWAGQVCLVVKTILDIRTFYYEKKISNKTRTNVKNQEPKEDKKTLTDGNNKEVAKHEINLIPENQDIEKERILVSSPGNSPTNFSQSKQLFWKANKKITLIEEQGPSSEDKKPLTNGNNKEFAKHVINLIPENLDIEKERILDSSPGNSPTNFSQSKQLFWKVNNKIAIVPIEEHGDNNIQIIDLKEINEEGVDMAADHKKISFRKGEEKELDVY